jgi:hypothetical protein
MQHRIRKSGSLGARHAAQYHSHEPGGDLIVRNFTQRIGVYKKLNFSVGKLSSIPLFADDIDGPEILG